MLVSCMSLRSLRSLKTCRMSSTLGRPATSQPADKGLHIACAATFPGRMPLPYHMALRTAESCLEVPAMHELYFIATRCDYKRLCDGAEPREVVAAKCWVSMTSRRWTTQR